MFAALAPDLTRAARLLARFGDRIHARLARRYHGADPDAVADAAMEAILAAAADPAYTEPDGDEFPRRLAEAARQRLRVRLRGDGRRRGREEIFARAVTARRAAAPSPADQAAARELAADLRPRLARTPDEAAVLELWLDGVTDPVDLAARTGVSPAAATRLLARLRQRMHRERARLQRHDPEEDDP